MALTRTHHQEGINGFQYHRLMLPEDKVLTELDSLMKLEKLQSILYNLAKEPQFYEGIPYLMETSNLRENQFTIATLMHLLWQKNADVLSDNVVNSLVGLPLKDAIKAILADYELYK